MNTKKFKRVSPEDFDVEMLLAAAREGRLYVDDSPKAVSRQEMTDKVHAYVARIRPLATPRFRELVDEVWERILACDEFAEILTAGTKARKCRDFNKYSVMCIIGVLREKGVYEQYSDRKFDALLEQPGKDSPYRRYLGEGLERPLLMVIRQIVGELSTLTIG